MEFFGEAIDNVENGERITRNQRGPQNLLNLLPEVFTYEEAGQMKQRVTGKGDSPKMMLSNWKKRGYIEMYGEVMPKEHIARQRYIKTEEYIQKNSQSV